MYKLLILSALISVAASHAIQPAAIKTVAPAPVAAVPALAAVPTLTAVHSQRLVPQPPAVHTVASPTTVLQTVQTGTAVVGHQKVGDQVVGKTPDLNGYAFRSDVRHDAPVHAYAAPIVAPAPIPVPVAAPAPVAVAAPAPVAVAAAPAPAALGAPVVHPAPPALSKTYSTEIGHTVAHDHVVTSPVIKNTLHAPVFGSQPIVAPVPVAVPAPVLAPAPVYGPAPLPAAPAPVAY